MVWAQISNVLCIYVSLLCVLSKITIVVGFGSEIQTASWVAGSERDGWIRWSRKGRAFKKGKKFVSTSENIKCFLSWWEYP